MSVATLRAAGRSAAVQPRASAVVAPSPGSALRALVRQGLHDNRHAPLTWGGSLGVMGACVAALYPSISGSVSDMVRGYPAGLKQAFGITDLGTIEAFLHAEMFSLFLPLAVCFLAIRCVASSIAGAQEHGYLDTILATPVTRRVLVSASFVTAAVTVAAALLVAGALTAAGAILVGEPIALVRLVAALTAVWGLALFFAGCATLAAGLLHRSAPVTGSAAALLGAMYLLDVLGKLSDSAEALRYGLAFRWYGAPLTDGADAAALVVLAVAAVLLAAAGAAFYERRDITG